MSNILPDNQKSMVRRLKVWRMAAGLVACATILLIAGIVVFLPTLLTISSRYNSAVAEVHKLKGSNTLPSAVDINSISNRAAGIRAKLAASLLPSPLFYIGHIRSVADSSIAIRGFTLQQSAPAIVEVNGVAANRTMLQAFVAALQKDPRIASVESPVSNFIGRTGNTFSIRVVFK